MFTYSSNDCGIIGRYEYRDANFRKEYFRKLINMRINKNAPKCLCIRWCSSKKTSIMTVLHHLRYVCAHTCMLRSLCLLWFENIPFSFKYIRDQYHPIRTNTNPISFRFCLRFQFERCHYVVKWIRRPFYHKKLSVTRSFRTFLLHSFLKNTNFKHSRRHIVKYIQ